MSTKFDFTLNGENLDVIDPYIYLGITFKYNDSFCMWMPGRDL
jgi:hypothetical protein